LINCVRSKKHNSNNNDDNYDNDNRLVILFMIDYEQRQFNNHELNFDNSLKHINTKF